MLYWGTKDGCASKGEKKMNDFNYFLVLPWIVDFLFLGFGLLFWIRPEVSWFFKEGRAYGKYGEKEMPEDRKQAHRIRGIVFFAVGVIGLIPLLCRM